MPHTPDLTIISYNLAFGAIYQCPSIQQIKTAQKYTHEGATTNMTFVCTV